MPRGIAVFELTRIGLRKEDTWSIIFLFFPFSTTVTYRFRFWPTCSSLSSCLINEAFSSEPMPARPGTAVVENSWAEFG